jgi:hypothetical protein
MAEDNELIVVYAGISIEAGFLKGLLEDAGVAAFLKDELTGTLAPWYVAPGGAGAVKVVIAKKDVDRAKPIVQKFLDKDNNG